MIGLFLCTESELDKERRGYVRAFRRRGVRIVTLDSAEAVPDVRVVLERLQEKPSFVLHPEVFGSPSIAEGLSEIDIPTLCFHIDTFSGLDNRIRKSMLFDYACVFHPGYEDIFLNAGHPKVILLPHAVEADLFTPGQHDRIYDIGWVGRTEGPIYATRRYLLSHLAQRFRLNDWQRYYSSEEMAEVLKRSKIALNISRDDYPQDANLRVFEAMASGALLITGIPSELTSLGFTEGQHFIGYRDKVEVESLVQYYLDHETERLAIARAGQALVLSEHTYERRVEQLLHLLEQDRGRLFAPARSWPVERVRRLYIAYYAKTHLLDRAFEELRALREMGLLAVLRGTPPILQEILWQFRISFQLRRWIADKFGRRRILMVK